MSETPPSYSSALPPAPVPAKQRFPVWLMVVGGLALVCICAGCVGAILLANSPMGTGAMAGGQITFICLEKNNNDSDLCSAWAQRVTSTPEFNTCVAELLTDENLSGASLYACLEENGVGP